MTVIDDYLTSLGEPEKSTIAHLYATAKQVAPDATEGISYAIPCLKYKNKSLLAIMANQKFMSLYPFGAVAKLGLDLSEFECTSGSIHFTLQRPIPDDLLRSIVAARMKQIDN